MLSLLNTDDDIAIKRVMKTVVGIIFFIGEVAGGYLLRVTEGKAERS